MMDTLGLKFWIVPFSVGLSLGYMMRWMVWKMLLRRKREASGGSNQGPEAKI